MKDDIRYRLRPHFLFNELSIIRYLVKKDPDAAYDMVYEFSDYLRKNIESMVEDGLISWSKELEHIRTYLRLEQIVWKDRLQVFYEIEGDFQVPSGSIILLVEKAVRYSIGGKEGKGILWIRSKEEADGYRIEIEDNGIGYAADKDSEKDALFSYLRERLALLPETDFTVEQTPEQRNIVRLWMR
jgi:LytS/YehU family sensor histidine kinase